MTPREKAEAEAVPVEAARPLIPPEAPPPAQKALAEEILAAPSPPAGPQRKITKLVIGCLFTAAIVFAAYALTGPRWGTLCLFLGLYEGWTLINQYREDTLSETIWEFAARPMIPWLFGIAVGWGAGSGYLGDPSTVGRGIAIGFLCGHFFFQRYGPAGNP